MTISYNWLNEYLPVQVEPERLSKILTSIGLEVETMHFYEEVKGSLNGLVIGEVLECEPHPNADKLKITKVNIGSGEPLQIVCGAPNVAAGQKVVVATVGTTIYPSSGDPLTMKVAKIRSVESHGMLCAEDELGLGASHAGIIVLSTDIRVGTPAANYFKPYTDHVYEIGLTPNRMDAMSHLGVARDVCAYLTHHDKKPFSVRSPYSQAFKADGNELPIKVSVENTEACQRYAGISITGLTIAPAPLWMQQRLKAIGVRPINNIVDITNYILHETGQPLHAFDAASIAGNEVVVKNLPEATPFITLDEKERKLSAEDLMICNAEEGMCIAGVFGGAKSGVKNTTTAVFLESAWFQPISIRKTSVRHGLRTDAATRFEKGVDISNTVNVLKRAAQLIKEITGGHIASDIIDIYPAPKEKTQISMKYHYVKKVSGKNYHPDAVKKIFETLGFELVKENIDELTVAVPYSKPDITLPADLVEEIMRIDGLDNIEIPSAIRLTPSVDASSMAFSLKEKIADYLVGQGFSEIFTNSITNSTYFSETELTATVRLLNNLSAELNVMRPSMLPTGLETIAYNVNRRNSNLLLFEFGKTYHTNGVGKYSQADHLSLYLTGQVTADTWHQKGTKADFFFAKGITEAILRLTGLHKVQAQAIEEPHLQQAVRYSAGPTQLAVSGQISPKQTDRFDIKQPVYYIDINWNHVTELFSKHIIQYREIAKFPAVQRDLAIVVNEQLSYGDIEQVAHRTKISKLTSVSLFDIFKSDKLGAGKKSMAISFTFQDEDKTLTDNEIDGMMGKIMQAFEKELNAEIRK